MKSVLKLSLVAATVALVVGCQQKDEMKSDVANMDAPEVVETITLAPNGGSSTEVVSLQTDDDKAAYAIGSSLAQYLKANIEQQQEIGLALNADLVLRGVQDSFNGQAAMTQEQAEAALQALDQRVASIMQEKSKERSQMAEKQGADYQAEFAKKEGVKTTDSGLMYQVKTMGDGVKPSAEDTVVVHYTGTLPDGTKFDSSYDRNEPATFPLNRVIPGWTEGLQLMPAGSEFTFVIPAELAYGAQDTPQIPANSTLVFDVKLLDVKKADKQPEAK